MALPWLQACDVEERKFRESTLTLGQVMCEVFTSRDARWSATFSAPDKKASEPTAASNQSPTKPPSSSLKLGKPINGKPVALVMNDGSKLCPQFQQGGCKAKPCPQGAHRGAAVQRANRVCGAFIHGAACHGKC